jgi:hypothetical protein
MRMSLQNTLLFAALWALLGLAGCKTEDVYPTLKLEVSTNNVANDGSSMRIQVRLNGPISNDLSVPLTFSGNAQINTHFSLSAEAITVAAGADTGFITLTALPTTDTTSRQVVVSLGNVSRVIVQTPVSQAINLVNANADRDGDGIPDVLDNCPDEAGPAINNGCPWKGLIINEVLYDPADGMAGDANGDGVRDPLADEFVEIYNDSLAYDISGFTLSDASQVRHTFPAGTIIPSRGVIVVFGGGNPTGNFGGSLVQTASTGQINLNNAGDVLTLRNASGAAIAVFDINGLSGNPNESYTRSPDITGAFLRHTTIADAAGRLHSPGTRLNGINF